MSHRVESLMTLGPAWHGLGVEVSECKNAKDALTLSGCEWETDLVPIQVVSGPLITTHKATIRSNDKQFLGVVPADYKILQNHELFDFLDSCVANGQAMFSTAGSLDSGRRIFCSCKLPNIYEVVPGVEILPYFLAINAHDGSLACRVFPTEVNTVCWNTSTQALQNERLREKNKTSRGLTVKHTANMHSRLDRGRIVIQQLMQEYDAYVANARRMVEKKLNQKAARQYFDSIFPDPSQDRVKAPTKKELIALAQSLAEKGKFDITLIDQIANYVEPSDVKERHYKERLDSLFGIFSSSRCTVPVSIKGSVWAAYNSVTEYIDHRSNTRNTIGSNKAETRFNALLFGPKATIKQTAWESALSLAG